MKNYQTNEIKNIALLGSAGSGKTTLAESMLFEAGVIKRRGTVEGKNTRNTAIAYSQLSSMLRLTARRSTSSTARVQTTSWGVPSPL